MGRLRREGPLAARPRLLSGCARGCACPVRGAASGSRQAQARPAGAAGGGLWSGRRRAAAASLREPPTVVLRACLQGGPAQSAPLARNDEVARLRVLREPVAQAGFELGARRPASPGVLPAVQRRAANRAPARVAASSPPFDSVLEASPRRVTPPLSHFITRTPGPKDGEGS